MDQLTTLLREVWQCRRVAVDASGLGADLAARLERALGRHVVEPVTFTVQTKSRLAYNLLARTNAGRLKMWAEAPPAKDGQPPAPPAAGGTLEAPPHSPEAVEFWREIERARPIIRSGEQLSFYVPDHQGHDDFVAMLALLAWTVRDVQPPTYRVMLPPAVPRYAPY
ncbi:MAG TPA: hypothetical protein VGW38_01305 [Chloroflexota bacterium]|nr:hypothetical protein [Chloroflexota bacterium]